MGLLKKLILAKGTVDLATNLTDRKLKKIGRRKKMFNNKYKNKPNIISRIAKAAFVVGASAYLLNKNKDEVKETVDDAKEKANRTKDDIIDAFNSEELK